MLEEQTQRILSTLPVQVRIGRLRLVVMDGGFFVQGHIPGEGYSTKFYTGRFRPEVQSLTLLYGIFETMVPLLHTFY